MKMKLFCHNKKGDSTAYWFFWILFGSVAVSIVVIILVRFHSDSVSQAARIPENIEDELILAARFYNSDDCFAYKDDIGRVHAKVIDSLKFKQENMKGCFPESNVKYAFLLMLEQPLPPGIQVPIRTFGTEPIKTFNWAEEGIAAKEITEDVFVLYEGAKYNGRLRIKIKNVI